MFGKYPQSAKLNKFNRILLIQTKKYMNNTLFYIFLQDYWDELTV